MPPPGRRGGKFSKPTRGGGKHFSRDLQPLDKDGNPIGMWRDPKDRVEESSEEESSEEESEEEDSEDETAAATGTASTDAANLSREQRKELARKKKAAAIARKNKKVAEPGDMPTSSEEDSDEEDEDMPANPNHTSKSRAQAQAVTGKSGETALPERKDNGNLSRREREAIEAQAAKERYQKLHAEGKTDEAKADLARLKLIKEQRENAAARKKAEQEERDAQAKDKEDERKAREEKLRAAAMGSAPGKKKGKK